MKYLFKIFAFN